MQRSTLAFITIFAACGTLEVPTEEGETGNPLEAPTIASVTPARGPLAGGNEVTITGTGFAEGTSVVIGGFELSPLTVESDTTIVATMPSGIEAEVSLEAVVFGGAGFASVPDAYTYNRVPTLETVSRSFGPLVGGSTLEVTGRFFETNNPGTPTVTVGGAEATDVEVLDDSTIRFVTPEGDGAESVLPQDIVVDTTNGSASLPEAYTYLRPGLLLATRDSIGDDGRGIFYLDIETARLRKLFDTGLGVGRFIAAPDGNFFLRLNNRSGNNLQWVRLDGSTGTLEQLGRLNNAAGGNPRVRGATLAGSSFIVNGDGQIGFMNPADMSFNPTNASVESQGCLAARNANEVLHINNINNPITTVDLVNGTSTPGTTIISNLGDNSTNMRCHGATMIGQTLFAMFFDRNQGFRPLHVLSINPANGAATEIAVLDDNFSGLEATPPGVFQ